MPSGAAAVEPNPARGSVVIGWFVILLWAGFAAISAWLAYRFGYGRALEVGDRRLYGALGVMVDLAKSVLPLCAVLAVGQQQRLLSFVLWVVFGLFTVFSMVAALGFAAEHLAARERIGSDETSVVADIRRMETRLGALGTTRAPGVIEKAIEAAYAQPSASGGGIGALSKRCTRDLLVTREVCGAIARMEVELATSREAEDLRKRVAQLREQRQRTIEERGAGDVQVEILSMLSRLPQDWVRTGLAVLLAVVIELGSGLLLYVGGTQIMGPGWHQRILRQEVPDVVALPAPAETHAVMAAEPMKGAIGESGDVPPAAGEVITSAVTEYMLARVDYGPGQVTAHQVYEDYRMWCDELGLTPRGRAIFGESFYVLAREIGIMPELSAQSGVVFPNVKLGPVAADS